MRGNSVEYLVPSIERLFADQEHLRAVSAELLELTQLSEPPERARISGVRWRLARALLRHLPLKDRLVYARLRGHADPAVAEVAQRYSDEAGKLYAMFEQHTAHWTPETVEAGWGAYGASVAQMTAMLDQRIAREEIELLPHLATAPEIEPRRSEGDRNWAADGWRIRALLGIDEAGAAA